MKQVGYRPFYATKRLNNGSDEDHLLDDVDKNLEESLRGFVFEYVRSVHYFGMKKATIPEIRLKFPKFFGYLNDNFAELLDGCICSIQTRDKLANPIPYVMLPDQHRTVISWDVGSSSHNFHYGEDFKRSLENLK